MAVPVEPYRFRAGTTPLIVSMPHVGIHIPDAIAALMTATARAVPDTDWHVDRLYDPVLDGLGAAVLQATHSRYVVDLNRPPDDASLYPGADVTGLVPTTTFAAAPIYGAGGAPDAAEITRRGTAFWQPYHDRLAAELARLKAAHGYALLWDAHSIRSVAPRFFDGRLPDLNLGTARGQACAPGLAQTLLDTLEAAEGDGYTTVLDGRFTGGHITRHYGRPADGVHAVQMELAQINYMDEDPPFTFRDDLAARLRPVLRACLKAMLDWGESGRPV